MEYIIRRATIEDSDAINCLFNEMLRTIYKNDTHEVYEMHYLEDNYFNSEKNVIYVAVADSNIIGYMSIEYHNEGDEPFLYLDDCSVTASWRSKGIGTRFFTCAERYAVLCGVNSIYFHVEKSNSRAYKLYKSLGYADYRDEGSRLEMYKIL